MRVVGISPLDQDATASIAEGGRLLFAAGEERFSRVKQHAGFPRESLAAAMDATATRPQDVDEVAYPFLTWREELARVERSLLEEAESLHDLDCEELRRLLAEADRAAPLRSQSVRGLVSAEQIVEKGGLKRLVYRLLALDTTLSRAASRALLRAWVRRARHDHRRWQRALESGLEDLGLGGRLRRYEHHRSHAANAFLNSGFERALVVTLDGYGTGLSGTIGLGEGRSVTRLAEARFPSSLGSLYEQVTDSLGFDASRHAGKVVGLAAYGEPGRLGPVLRSMLDLEPGRFRLRQPQNHWLSRHLATRFPMIDVAAAYQETLELVATEWVGHWARETQCDSVVLSGGVLANVKLNQRIFEIERVERIFVYPNMGDGGCGSGLAVMRSLGSEEPVRLESVYLGPEYSDAEMREALEGAGLSYEAPAELAFRVARLLDAGDVVARFDGRMEYGPRALGNRSILYEARDPAVNDWLNQRLGRSEFMPFAPVTLFERRDRCFSGTEGAEQAGELMTITFDCTPFMRERCPAAVHVDGTARPQLLRREINPGYYSIVEEYEKLSGLPCLVNTSFNMHEEPIVCSPQDAVRAFQQGGLDCLVMGPFLATQPESAGR